MNQQQIIWVHLYSDRLCEFLCKTKQTPHLTNTIGSVALSALINNHNHFNLFFSCQLPSFRLSICFCLLYDIIACGSPKTRKCKYHPTCVKLGNICPVAEICKTNIHIFLRWLVWRRWVLNYTHSESRSDECGRVHIRFGKETPSMNNFNI